MGIVAEDVERVRAATDMVVLVSEHVGLRRVGRRWSGLCPFHAEKTPSFSVNGELGLYYCFGCQARGDAISFLRETEHLDFASAVEALAGRAGIQVRYDAQDTSRQGGKRNSDLAKALERAVEWYHDVLLRAPEGAPARAYLRGRGYDSETVKHFRLGWAPGGWDTLVRGAGIGEDMLVGAGLAYRGQADRLIDSFRARVLFPIFDVAGRPVGLGGRVLPGASGSKYKNTQATPLYDKSRVLYGLNWAKGAIVERNQVVVCEGYTDVIGLHRAGITEAVATCGTALAEGHVRLLTGFSRRVVLAYDADAAGRGAAERFYEWERRFQADIAVVSLPAGTDPADSAQHLDIFISYASEDLPRVQPLVEALGQHGWSVWWDRSIRPGKTWEQIIDDKLNDARCVIVLWSRHSIQSDWVKIEAGEAKRRQILVPAILDTDLIIPLAFRHLQAANLADASGAYQGAGFENLISALSEVLSESAAPPAPSIPPSAATAPAPAPSRSPVLAPRFLHRAHAVAVSGQVVWPFDEVIPAQAASALPASGGYCSSRMANYRLRDFFSHRLAHSEAMGRYNERNQTHDSSVKATVEGFNLYDSISAESLTVSIAAVHHAGDEPEFTTGGSTFYQLRVAGRAIELESRAAMYDSLNTMEKLRHAYDQDNRFREIFDRDVFLGEEHRLPRSMARYFPFSRHARADRLPEDEGVTIVPLFVVAHPVAHEFEVCGNVIRVPGFGTIQLGEMVISSHSRQVTMVQVDFSSRAEGSITICSADLGGRKMPFE